MVYFRPERCYRRSGFNRIPVCDGFEKDVLAHPEIARRLQYVNLIRWVPDGKSAGWPAGRPGLALMRVDGTPILQWTDLPNGTNMARILDAIVPHAATLVSIDDMLQIGRTEEADLATAMLQIRFGFNREATSNLERLAKSSRPDVRGIAAVRLAFMDVEKNRERGLASLRSLASTLDDPAARGEAWLAIATLSSGDEKIRSLENAVGVSSEGSPQKAIAAKALADLRQGNAGQAVIRVAPLSIASGPTEVRTIVQSSQVDSVEFILDGRSIIRDTSAPFRAMVDLERLPTRHELRVIARDPKGAVLGEDTTTLNGRSDTFWVRFIAPRGEMAAGSVQVELAFQIPDDQKLASVEIEHGGTVTAVAGPPYRATLTLPPDQMAVLQARARLTNGRTAEDTKILNAPGLAQTAAVHLVEVPLIPIGDEPLEAGKIHLMESGHARQIDSLVRADEAPLTLGLVIDTSASMANRMLDVQAAAARLLEQVLRPQDRGFLVAFDTNAALDVGVTSERERLLNAVRALSPRAGGSTALYDGMMLGLLQFEPLGGRRAMIVFSDGDDSASRYKIEDVAEVAKRAAVPVYLVRLQSEEEPPSSPPTGPITQPLPRTARPPQSPIPTLQPREQKEAQIRLEHLTLESGGGFFQLDSLAAIDSVFADIGRLVSRQMLLVYRTDSSSQEEWRPIEVRIDGKANVRAPRGYYMQPDHGE